MKAPPKEKPAAKKGAAPKDKGKEKPKAKGGDYKKLMNEKESKAAIKEYMIKVSASLFMIV